jgi:DNA-binding MarR family transcriptional regulator
MTKVSPERPHLLTRSRREGVLEQAAQVRRGAATIAGRLRFEREGVLTVNQTELLSLLFRFGDVTPGTLAGRVGRSPQALTRILQKLETTRLIERRSDPADGRQSLLAITLEGREALAREMRPRDEWFASVLLEQCTDTERELLVIAAGLLERLASTPVSPGRQGRAEDEE